MPCTTGKSRTGASGPRGGSMYATAQLEVPRSTPMTKSFMCYCRSVGKGNSHKKAQKSQRDFTLCLLCLFVAIPVRSFLSNPHVHFELPPPGSCLLETSKLQRADFSHGRLQVHRHQLAGLAAECRFNGR